ncbi:MAG: 4a-hydroxytetrahydrobiopterin dehydratase [Myxococcales bacterium]|nr:4a-hydroxytetrahydrobiopterin dehydratase [Myxococcales bacterium]USN51316.1 MAG: 4a-hydroxytetrahydrobiopterin dehydratase [Myxococcales bacterium]
MENEKIDFASENVLVPQADDLPMTVSEAVKLLPHLEEGWSVNQAGHLEKVFLVKNFKASLDLANTLGKIAESVGYYPNLLVSYAKLRVEIWSTTIGGLSRADFILAAKIDQTRK